MSLKDLYLAHQTTTFRKTTFTNLCNGTDLYKLSENEEYLEYLSKVPQAVLVIPSQYCDEQCKKNLETVKNKLDYELIDSNGPDLRKTDSRHGKTIYPYGHDNERLNSVAIFLSSWDEIGESQERPLYLKGYGNYIYLTGYESDVNLPGEFTQILFEGLFGIERSIECTYR